MPYCYMCIGIIGSISSVVISSIIASLLYIVLISIEALFCVLYICSLLLLFWFCLVFMSIVCCICLQLLLSVILVIMYHCSTQYSLYIVLGQHYILSALSFCFCQYYLVFIPDIQYKVARPECLFQCSICSFQHSFCIGFQVSF